MGYDVGVDQVKHVVVIKASEPTAFFCSFNFFFV